MLYASVHLWIPTCQGLARGMGQVSAAGVLAVALGIPVSAVPG